MVFVLTDIAQEFDTDVTKVIVTLLLTLAMPTEVGLIAVIYNIGGVSFGSLSDYAFALTVVADAVAVVMVILTALGTEAKGAVFVAVNRRDAPAGSSATANPLHSPG
jgi:hypothetical protein